MSGKRKGFTLIELMIVLAIIAITATLVISNLASSRKAGNETSAIKGIQTCIQSQGVFKKSGQGTARAGDSDSDGNAQEYADSLANLLDGAGQPLVPMVNIDPYHGYNYAVVADPDPEVAGFAEAGPQTAASDGDRDFAADTVTGVVWMNAGAGGGLPGVIPWDIAGVANPGPGGTWVQTQE